MEATSLDEKTGELAISINSNAETKELYRKDAIEPIVVELGTANSDSITSRSIDSPQIAPLSEGNGIPAANKTKCDRKRYSLPTREDIAVTLDDVKQGTFSIYRQLFALTFLANAGIFLYLMIIAISKGQLMAPDKLATAATVNLFVSIFIRNEHVINSLYILAACLPLSAPLKVRRSFASIYNYGGVHSGCAVAAVFWHAFFCAVFTYKYVDEAVELVLIIVIVPWVILGLMLGIVIFAHPSLRSRWHNNFERVHRFTGWAAILAFWLQLCVMVVWSSRESGEKTTETLVKTTSFWFLVGTSLCVAYPWIRLRRRAVRVESLSNHAVRLHFDHARPHGCTAIRISDKPLSETHAFAVIPASDKGTKSYSIIVSDAGDWTSRIIQNPPQRLWVRGAPQYGVLRVAVMFKPAVLVATGSGIGPCLGLFSEMPNLPVRVVWSASDPEQTYKQGIVDSVLNFDPEAIIIDTAKVGRTDMVRTSYKVCKEVKAEAVIIISNPRLTRSTIRGLERRGVPAFGPIWDC